MKINGKTGIVMIDNAVFIKMDLIPYLFKGANFLDTIDAVVNVSERLFREELEKTGNGEQR